MEGTKVIFLDVDETICPHGSFDMYPGMAEKLNKLADAGFHIFLFTARRPAGLWISELKRQGLRFVDVIEKPSADKYYYVDDKVFGSFQDVDSFIKDVLV